MRRALADPELHNQLRNAAALDVVAAGKAAAVMLTAFDDWWRSILSDVNGRSAEMGDREGVTDRGFTRLRTLVGIGPEAPASLPEHVEWFTAGHPLPTPVSVAAARRALELAHGSGPDDVLLVLLSGGGSALMALPAEGIALEEKQRTARMLMERGADIYELNTVRKHLSAIKGGRLAVAAQGAVVTLAVSDVVGDDLSVIASGPTVADNSTYADALNVLAARAGLAAHPAAIVERLRRGAAGEIDETPKTGDVRLERSMARVIGRQRGAIDGARSAAAASGYSVVVIPDPITGEARVAAADLVERVGGLIAQTRRPVCVIGSGETTVTVRGTGKGGRNQEFAFALARRIGTLGTNVAGASIGTDGIDGPTDAAGALVDASTFERAAAIGIADPQRYLDNNDTYRFFDRLGDLVRTGPTSTNVGDIQVILVGE